MNGSGDTDPKKRSPFSPSPFRDRSGTGRSIELDLTRANINDASIPDQEGGGRTGKPRYSMNRDYGARMLAAEPLISARPIPQRHHDRQSGIRLLPLASFVWGSRANPPQPRTRGDHTLIWVQEDGLQLEFPRASERLTKDSVHFIPLGTAFAALPRPGVSGKVLLIAPALLRDIQPGFPEQVQAGNSFTISEQLDASIRNLIAASTQKAGKAAIQLHLANIAVLLSQLQPTRSVERHDRAANRDERPLFERFLVVAGDQLRLGKTIADLADELGTSSAALDRACMAARGARAIEVLHRLQLDRAISMLRQGNQSPAQIARELGYTSLAHFSRVIVAATGRLPERLRDSK